MAYAHKVCRVTFSGTMWQGQEEWSTGLFLGQESADSTAPTQESADALAQAFGTMFTHGNMGISNAYTFDKVKMASIGTNGQTIANEVVYASLPGTITGAATTNFHPSQCSLVVTLMSDRPRGVASKGRMYLPGTAQTIESNGRIGTTARNNISGILDTFFQNFMDQFLHPGSLILAAKQSGPLGVFPPQNDYVQSFKVGDVVDTQRRRRNGLSETYQTTIL